MSDVSDISLAEKLEWPVERVESVKLGRLYGVFRDVGYPGVQA